MRHLLLIAIAVFVSSASTYLIVRAAEAESKATAVVADEAKGVVRIMIDGEEIAQFERRGLVVDGYVSATMGMVPFELPETATVERGR